MYQLMNQSHMQRLLGWVSFSPFLCATKIQFDLSLQFFSYFMLFCRKFVEWRKKTKIISTPPKAFITGLEEEI